MVQYIRGYKIRELAVDYVAICSVYSLVIVYKLTTFFPATINQPEARTINPTRDEKPFLYPAGSFRVGGQDRKGEEWACWVRIKGRLVAGFVIQTVGRRNSVVVGFGIVISLMHKGSRVNEGAKTPHCKCVAVYTAFSGGLFSPRNRASGELPALKD